MRYTSDLQLEIRAFSASLTNRDGSLCHAFIQDWRLLEPYVARMQRDFDMEIALQLRERTTIIHAWDAADEEKSLRERADGILSTYLAKERRPLYSPPPSR